MSSLSHTERNRVIVVLAVLLIPFIVLIAFQYHTLREIERASVVVERHRIQASLDRAAAEVDARLADLLRKRLEEVAALRNADALPFDLPGGEVYFFHQFASSREQSSTIYFDDQGKLMTEAYPLVPEVVESAVAAWRPAAYQERIIESDPPLDVTRLKWPYRLASLAILDDRRHLDGIAGTIVDESTVDSEFVRPILQQSLERSVGGSVLEFSTAADDSEELRAHTGARTPFTGLLAGRLLLAETLRSTPEELARRTFVAGSVWTSLVALLFLFSILFAARTSLREMRLARMKSDFVSNVSHELRTPISSIRVFGEHLSRGRVIEPEQVRNYGARIETESLRLTRLIDDILDFSRLESGGKDYEFEEVDPSEIVEDAIEIFMSPLNEEQVRLLVTLEDTGPLTADREALTRALLNLLDNAMKYSAAPRISIRVTRHGEMVRISVNDNGVGIEPDERARIFDKFYRIGNSLVHDVKGTGLGLAIVKHVVTAHGGTISVESEPGEGSSFTISLPVRENGEENQ